VVLKPANHFSVDFFFCYYSPFSIKGISSKLENITTILNNFVDQHSEVGINDLEDACVNHQGNGKMEQAVIIDLPLTMTPHPELLIAW
jgi:hypothetical protein